MTCSHCATKLKQEWFEDGLRAYQCRVCDHLTGLEGQDLGIGPKRGFRLSGLLIVALAVLAIIAIFIAQQLQ